ncbi:hypothetical protein E5676_scaffold455G007860 [Cucumis melo var. makuwa]|uniref:Uncharacterized protein n=1 Tax=Cucumis melo var. makuwa TaxID=1194695 RepID=A0A5D3E761_CUCMM|nr:hypothetical protein E5676_scaffold455G007860 [Cucumis melo var. makuwa]
MDGEPVTGLLRYNLKVVCEDYLEVLDMKEIRSCLHLLSESCAIPRDRWPINVATMVKSGVDLRGSHDLFSSGQEASTSSQFNLVEKHQPNATTD